MTESIAIVGMACRYPDASSPDDCGRRCSPDDGRSAGCRTSDALDDYWHPDAAPDTYLRRQGRRHRRLGVRPGRVPDRRQHLPRHRPDALAGAGHRGRALEDAGLPDGDGLPRSRTACHHRQQPDRRVHPGQPDAAALAVRPADGRGRAQGQGWDDAGSAGLPRRPGDVATRAPFPPIDEDTLAGGLANTIAGRICNHFDFGGGGYTVDGACSSSLLAVADRLQRARRRHLDAAVAGGVDLSIDPFEIIGFAKTGALATERDARLRPHSNGFWPGEGCGMVVLMREDDADARGLRVYATIAGWGYSSDGRGGMTRPEASGHRRAIDRAYRLAGFDIGTVGYLEGHGTGTAVGDATELRAFTEARRAAARMPRPPRSAPSRATSGTPRRRPASPA